MLGNAARQSDYVDKWIPRLGMFAKANLVFLPKIKTIVALMPQSFIDCGMGKVVLVGDCKDHDVHDESGSLVGHADLPSSKTGGPVAMGQAWCTPTGFVAVAADLVLGRGSEQELSKAVGELVFCDIPAQYSLCYDRGVAKLRLHLQNLNQVLTPCFIKQAARFTVEQGIRNRGVTCNRYIVEVLFACETSWKFMSGCIAHQDFHLVNGV
jgi:hypothetical protein